ncbi:MAG: sigma-54-dependent Fis family transcriptional regulator, partial [Bacteroidales bacterium]
MEQCSILVVDDDPDILITTELFLSEHFSHVGTISDPWKIIPTLKQDSYDIVLLDMNFQKGIIDGQEGLTWLEKIKNHDPNIVVVLMTAYGDVNLAVQGLKMGALDFILKPWKNEKLLGSVLSGLQIRRSRLEVERLKLTRQTIQQDVKLETDQIISHSPGMNSVVEAAGKVATTDANVLLLGENGVGKDLVAQYIHTLSQRKDQVYVRVDLGAIPESLFESELFGHTKGAFTDAATDKPGRFEIASGGTIFLDEIGNL